MKTHIGCIIYKNTTISGIIIFGDFIQTLTITKLHIELRTISMGMKYMQKVKWYDVKVLG